MDEPFHVLVVEDNPDARNALCELLQLHGYRTAAAATAADARLRLHLRVPDIVVLDAGLPDSSGFDLAREIKERYRAGAPTIIVFTGYHRLEHAARDAGCDAFVPKPNIPLLLRALDGAAAERRSRPVAQVARRTRKSR
jgi:CheY-like chemotaxis protein